MKRINKGIFSLIAITSFMSVVHAAPSYSLSVSSSRIESGSSVTATLTLRNVASWSIYLEGYGSTSKNCKQTYADVTSNGGNTTKYLTITCKSTDIGGINFTFSGDATSADGSQTIFNLNDVNKYVAVTTPRQKDSNNNLKSLGVSGYNLTPVFNADTLEYSVDLPNTVNKIVIEGEKASSYATISGTGEFEVSEGANAFSVVVTSETGSVKEYKINVNVKDENPIKINILDNEYTIVKNAKKIEVPQTYEATTIKINDIEVPAFYSEVSNYTLVAIKNGKGDLFFAIYDKDKNNYTLYNENKSDQLLLYIMNITDDLEGFSKSTIKINDKDYDCLKKDNLIIVKALNIVTGKDNYYIYDKESNSYVLYDINIFKGYEEEIDNYKKVLLCLGGCSIFIIFVLILIILHNPKKKKKRNVIKEDELKVNKIEKEKKEEIEEKKIIPKDDITSDLDKATKIIDDFENNNKKKEIIKEDLEPTMYDIFSDDKKKNKKKKKR